MNSPALDPFQTSALSSAACAYLLRSAVDTSKIKLGITCHLNARIDSLRKSYGPLDLRNSVVIGARNRRAAFDLEAALRMAFAAPAWRVEAGPHDPAAACVQVCNGNTEWYAVHAAEPMLDFVEEVIRRDESGGGSRYRIERGTDWYEAWCQHMSSAPVRLRMSDHDREVDAKARLDESETNFQRLQTWFQVRLDRLVEVRSSLSDHAELPGRVFVLRKPCAAAGVDEEAARAEWEELACACLVAYRHDHVCGTVSYFGGVDMYEACPAVYSVELVTPAASERLTAAVPALGGLLGRIKEWLYQV